MKHEWGRWTTETTLVQMKGAPESDGVRFYTCWKCGGGRADAIPLRGKVKKRTFTKGIDPNVCYGGNPLNAQLVLQKGGDA